MAENGMNSDPKSADELNRIPAASIGGAIEDFGFPTGYVESPSGLVVGTGLQPEVALLPAAGAGAKSEGPVEASFAPQGFPSELSGGIFVGFHGLFNAVGIANDENPVLWFDPASGETFHFLSTLEPELGHPNGLLATDDALYVIDLASTSNLFGSSATGRIHRIRAVPSIPSLPGGGWLVLGTLGTLLFAARVLRRRSSSPIPPTSPISTTG